MKKTTVQNFAMIPETVFQHKDREAIEELVSCFSKRFEINWEKDVNVTISVKYKEIGSQMVQLIKVNLKDTEVTHSDPDQEELPFELDKNIMSIEFVNKETGEYTETETKEK